ncbi:amino acid/amide ABC transporter ATP-binding protein 2, HAAT family [Thermaerobacter marianensis DSM 12885]|uniref:Amino acid/amide ABC transporter ATP-binding protein 2, HAAT family n=1 Tax=Thermaerobacter marianensis (strain ATCC 700841 / DSM 12885 / JCM 10246 / 7p75a) TaxID=644966 RepID=E6SLX7_THEM7|nr:ABC transporter ATP-binding protein [Thermaerobacter marianensis]ADU52435.1 amino acid/amide ABC transporter ATP-binding protein 2, HAAT family [Thermaerobacter marianensis DSM 12885]
MLLTLEQLNVAYGAIKAVQDLSLEVEEGEIVALLGANGAGKTTTLRTVSGLIRPRSGKVVYDGHVITHWPAHRIVEAGLVHVPEGRRVFAPLTVRENLELGAYTVRQAGEVEARMKAVFAKFPRLEERQHQLAGTLSGGEQQMLAIGRALMARPRLLLLDEPSLGLAPLLVREIFATIKDINQRDGVTILLVEQNAHQALQIAHRAYVLESGRMVLSGPAASLMDNPKVREAYLGA